MTRPLVDKKVKEIEKERKKTCGTKERETR
jgi:hypothetical protein